MAFNRQSATLLPGRVNPDLMADSDHESEEFELAANYKVRNPGYRSN